MGRYRFVDPENVRLPISDGDWVEIPKGLSIADDIQFGRAKSEGDVIQMLALMVRDWSLLDRDEKKMPIGPDTVSHLDTDTAVEIASAIAKHYREEKESQKKQESQTTSFEKESISSVG